VKRKDLSFDVSLDDSDADSLADSAPPAKRSKKTSVTTTPAGSPSVILPRRVGLDDQMHDCKPSALVEPTYTYRTAIEYSRSASASSQRTWTTDAKDPNLIMPIQEQFPVTQSSLNYPQPHPVSSAWVATSMPNSLASISMSGQSMPQGAFPVEAPMSTYPGCHNYQFPQQSPAHAPVDFKPASPYVTTQISQPQLEALPASTAYTAPVMSSPYVGYGHYNNNNNNVDYYGQPGHSQSQLFAVPGATAINTNFGYSVPPNSPFSHVQPWHTADAVTNYQYQHETAPPSYPLPEPRHSSAFQAPARIDRGFTGHGSGVGGGAHT
jgi:hypothetical protein